MKSLIQKAPACAKNHSTAVTGTGIEKFQDRADIQRNLCASMRWNSKENELQGCPWEERAGHSQNSPSAYLEPWPQPAPFDPHACDCWRLISCSRNLPVPHAPILQPTYKLDCGTNTSTLTSGKPESRSWSPSQARCNRVKWEVKQN